MITNNWCIKGCEELSKLLCPNSNVTGEVPNKFYYIDDLYDCFNSKKWKFDSISTTKEEITLEYFKEFILNKDAINLDNEDNYDYLILLLNKLNIKE